MLNRIVNAATKLGQRASRHQFFPVKSYPSFPPARLQSGRPKNQNQFPPFWPSLVLGSSVLAALCILYESNKQHNPCDKYREQIFNILGPQNIRQKKIRQEKDALRHLFSDLLEEISKEDLALLVYAAFEQNSLNLLKECAEQMSTELADQMKEAIDEFLISNYSILGTDSMLGGDRKGFLIWDYYEHCVHSKNAREILYNSLRDACHCFYNENDEKARFIIAAIFHHSFELDKYKFLLEVFTTLPFEDKRDLVFGPVQQLAKRFHDQPHAAFRDACHKILQEDPLFIPTENSSSPRM